jgi:hypothetical protein
MIPQERSDELNFALPIPAFYGFVVSNELVVKGTMH